MTTSIYDELGSPAEAEIKAYGEVEVAILPNGVVLLPRAWARITQHLLPARRILPWLN